MIGTVHFGAWLCYFLAMLSVGWIICERSSDWETERWGNQVRATLLIFSAIALVCFWIFLGNLILGVNKMPQNDAYVAAVVLGAILGPIVYWVYRKYLFPRAPVPKPEYDESSQLVPRRPARRNLRLLDWLVMDFGTIKKIRKAKRDKREAEK